MKPERGEMGEGRGESASRAIVTLGDARGLLCDEYFAVGVG